MLRKFFFAEKKDLNVLKGEKKPFFLESHIGFLFWDPPDDSDISIGIKFAFLLELESQIQCANFISSILNHSLVLALDIHSIELIMSYSETNFR